jgi:hypothetical protein
MTGRAVFAGCTWVNEATDTLDTLTFRPSSPQKRKKPRSFLRGFRLRGAGLNLRPPRHTDEARYAASLLCAFGGSER